MLNAADLLENFPQVWTVGQEAECEEGWLVGAEDKEACKWCAIGAVRAQGINGARIHQADTDHIIAANDNRGRKQAIKVLREIAKEDR